MGWINVQVRVCVVIFGLKEIDNPSDERGTDELYFYNFIRSSAKCR